MAVDTPVLQAAVLVALVHLQVFLDPMEQHPLGTCRVCRKAAVTSGLHRATPFLVQIVGRSTEHQKLENHTITTAALEKPPGTSLQSGVLKVVQE